MHVQKSTVRTLAACLLVLAAPQLSAQTNELIQAGNDLFRAGQYAQAVENYEAALGAGIDTPLLQYNLGIAYYRIGNFQKAELALSLAAEDPALAALATYNLGLATLASGWPEVAAARFEEVLALSSEPRLSALARRALERTQTGPGQPVRSAARVSDTWQPWREAEPPIGQMSFVVAARYGTDDNVYRTPSAPYVDINQAGQPLITPIRQSASFMPVDLLTHYAIEAPELETRFNFAYRLNGDFYDSEFANADVVTQRLEVGADVELDGKHARALETNFFGVIHDETNYDPDTGLDREFAGEDISNRFSYRGAGLETYYDHDLERWRFGFDTRVERKSYDDDSINTRYDHEFYQLKLWTEWYLSEVMALDFSVSGYRREYDVRRARDLTGVLSIANPTLEYAYASASIGVERQMTGSLSLRGVVRQTERTDNFDGYADYSQTAVGIGLTYRPNRRTRLSLDAIGRSFDYPNAFAFNQPAGGSLSIDATDAEIDFEFRINTRITIWAEYGLVDDSSSDPRIAYARNLAILGIKWRH